ncbi:ATP-binding cassette domain-containing protein [Arcticibacterium luteifluviistationis]|uniref:ABC transporter n=1 Tax=Arcticibacterium luteifluviistationis TaxID=1784714 RepID=A0A2Z4GG73_9BACT|nr:ATP-binding cassette domain-containing protein [Arcticibacterium luteifluviistationis]AWV99793.1 ABC transporter [Arcticibacterium luteifluviistationis]
MISFNQVFIKKGENTVLTDINLELADSQNFGIIGENGSGKSTLIDAMAGKIFPWKGKVSKPHYSKIELVPRDYGFHRLVGPAYQYYQQRYHAHDSEIGPTLYEVIQNQVMPVGTVDSKSVDLPEAKYDKAWVEEIADKMKISHLLERKVTSLSNGETRRSLIALSLLKKPKILLLDNPFIGLDQESKSALKALMDNMKVQLVLVANVDDMPDCIDKLIELKSGEIEGVLEKPFPSKERKDLKIEFDHELLEHFKTAKSEKTDSVIKIVNGKVVYGDKPVLQDINWEVKAGEKWALMGPNGSGKSTLLSLITGDNPQAYQNQLYLFGKRRGTGESIWDLKKRMGYLSPEMHIYFPKNMQVWKVIASGLFDTIGLFKKLSDVDKVALEKIMKLLDLESIENRLLSELSTGEQRLVLLARALVKNPELLLFDEACQNLDYNHMVFIRDLVNELVSKLNKTLIYVTHNVEELPAVIDKKILLENGRML